jgi:folate-binding protein YgfZ
MHEVAALAGAVFVEESGFLLPAHFGDAAGEYHAACIHAALFDRSHHGQLELTGRDARTFLHNLSTNDVKNLAPGAGCEAFLTTAKARAVAYILIGYVPQEDRDVLWLDVGPGQGAKVQQHLDHYLISERVEIVDHSRDFTQLHLCGPHAHALLNQVLDDPLSPMALLHHQWHRLGGAGGLVRRHDPLGLPGYDLIGPVGEAPSIWQTLVDAGARPAGRSAYEVLRVEAGTPVFGVDIDENRMVVEVGRGERAICYTKGCYLGQEPIVMARDRGHVNRTLLGLKISGDGPVPHGAKVFRDSNEVGLVTSSVVSPRLETAIALAYIRRGSQEPGTVLEVETGQGRHSAEVTTLPFVIPGTARAT